MKKSMVDLAKEALDASSEPMTFLDIWQYVGTKMGYNDTQKTDNIAQFYTDLTIDGRFSSLPGNTWDLRKRQTLSASTVDADALTVEDDAEDEDELAPNNDEDEDEVDDGDEDDEDLDMDEDESFA